jgi:hypothetical protein
MRENKVHVTTYDTKKIYVMPPEEGQKNPPIWEVVLTVTQMTPEGKCHNFATSRVTIHLEEATLKEHDLVGQKRIPTTDPNGPSTAPPTPEDLILKLLELVGVYPSPPE